MKTLICGIAFLLLSHSMFATLLPSITQYGITWTFSAPANCGQFATGDWWVVGPVIIQSVSPAPTGIANGSMVNPLGGKQGYDNRGGNYDATTAVSFPFTLQPGQSMVSSVSKPPGANIYSSLGCLQTQAILTAVSAPQPAGTFRPAYGGTYKKYFNISQINWAMLPNLPPPADAPNGNTLLSLAQSPRIDMQNDWTIQYSCAQTNWNVGTTEPCYGADYSDFMSDAALYVLLNTPQRNELTEVMIQWGIDNYGALRAGTVWPGNGGHASGRKWPIVFAGKILGDTAMLNMGADYAPDGYFGENDQTYYGVNGIALWGTNGDPQYFLAGCTGSGAKDARDPAHLVDGCPDYRNCCTSHTWVGQMLSALMIGAKGSWDHNAYFDYVDRWMNRQVGNITYFSSGSSYDDFVDTMWARYRNHLPTISADTVAPSSPTSLTASNITNSSLTLSWNASTDNVGVAGYDVYENGLLIQTVTTPTANVTGLSPGTVYSFYVVGKDSAGNASPPSNTVKPTTLSGSNAGSGSGISIYPNPVYGHECYIDFGKTNYGKATIELIDINGATVYACTSDGASRLFLVSFGALASGVYGIRINNGWSIVIRKLVIMN
jgi:fibronectin type III domain protein/type IX secretion system substrate protein